LQKSEKHFKQSIQLNPQLVMAYNNYACLLRRLQRFEESLKTFQSALDIDPNFIMAKRNMKRTHEMMATSKHPVNEERSNTNNEANISVGKDRSGAGKDEKCFVM